MKAALITGASRGIGAAAARLFAENGYHVIVNYANSEEKAHALCDEIEKNGGKATPVRADVTDRDDVRRMISLCVYHCGGIDVLINNAGIFSFDTVTDTPERKINCFLDLHCRAVTMLSREFAERFKKRGSGRILNMSSMSCWMPMPGIAMYSATKAYIRVFSRALHYEMRDSGVSVTVACPGGIATDLFGLPPNLMKLAVRIHAVQTPEKFVHKAVNKMLRGKKQYINGFINRLAIVAVGMTPTGVRMLIKHKMLDRDIKR